MDLPYPDASRRRLDYLLVGALTLLAGAVRFFRLGEWSLWADEVFTVRDALRFPAELTINPIPYACVAGAFRLLGVSEWAARLVPALVGTLSVPVVAAFGGRLFERRTGWLAALFVAFSPWHLFWSQNARHYVFTFLFASLAALAFYEGFERNDIRRGMGSWIGVVCLALSHVLAGALILGFAGYVGVVWWWRRRFGWSASRRRFVLIYFVPFVVGSGIVLVVPALREGLFSGWGHNLWARDAFYIVGTFVLGVTLPVVGMAVLGWARGFSARKQAATFLASVVAFPFVFFLGASFVQNVAGYYLFFVTPFVFVLAGRGCAACFEGGSRLVGWSATVAVIAALVAADVVYFTAERGGREDWKGAFAELAPILTERDRVLMLLPDVGAFYLPSARVEKLTLDDIAEPNRLMEPRAGITYLVVDAKAFATLDPSERFRRWVDAHARRVVRRALFARTSDRTVEIFRLDATSTGTPNPPR